MTMNEIRVRDIDPRPRSPYWFGTTTREQFDSLIQSLLSLSLYLLAELVGSTNGAVQNKRVCACACRMVSATVAVPRRWLLVCLGLEVVEFAMVE